MPAEAQLERVADDLLERRVGGEEVVDDAGESGAGATELERRRRAIGHRISGIEVDVRCDLVGEADGRIEMEVVRVTAEESVVRALETDPGEIETPAAGQRQAIGRVERVERVDADIGVVRLDRSIGFRKLSGSSMMNGEGVTGYASPVKVIVPS